MIRYVTISFYQIIFVVFNYLFISKCYFGKKLWSFQVILTGIEQWEPIWMFGSCDLEPNVSPMVLKRPIIGWVSYLGDLFLCYKNHKVFQKRPNPNILFQMIILVFRTKFIIIRYSSRSPRRKTSILSSP